MLDVVVVGAGPAGSRAAYKLALQGYNVCVLEKRPRAGLKTCCTGIISQECFTKYNIPQDLIYRQIRTAKVYSPSGLSLKVTRPDVQACVVNRSALDIYLSGLAMDSGVKYLFNSSVEEIISAHDEVTLYIKSNGSPSKINAQSVILACGFNTPLVRKAGFGQSRYFTTGVQSDVEAPGLEEIEVFFGNRIAPGFFSWLVPTLNGHALAGSMSRHSAGSYLRTWLAYLNKTGKISSSYGSFCYSGIPMYPLSCTYKNNVLVLGDAAGQVKPSTGGGIYFGWLCADIAANTLHNYLSSTNSSTRSLSGYQSGWHKVLFKELRAEYLSRRIFQQLNDSRIDKIFASALSGGWLDRLINDNNIAFDWHGRVLSKTVSKALSGMLRTKLLRYF